MNRARKPEADTTTVVCSVVNDRFLDGFVVLLYSLRRHNPWFQDTEVRVIHSTNWCPLSEHAKNIILAVHPNTTFHCAAEAAFKPINFKIADDFFESFNENKDKREHYGKCIYLKMWSFTFDDVDQIVFIDADMLCLADISHLWTLPHSFCAAKKGQILPKHIKQFNSFRAQKHVFNAGMYVAKKPYLGYKFFLELIECAKPGHRGADQDVLYDYFNNKEVLYLDSAYNVNHKNLVEYADESIYTDFGQIRMLHLTGKKPWEKARGEWNRCDKHWWEYYDLADRYLATYHHLHLEGQIDYHRAPDVKREFAELLEHHAFYDYIRGKSVVLIGPAETLIGSKLCDTFESYDVVVRLNTVYDFFPFTEEIAADYGSRTDVLYLTRFELNATTQEPYRLAEVAKSENLKYLVCANNSMHGAIVKTPKNFWKPRRIFEQQHLPTRLRFADLAPELIRTWLGQLVGYPLCPRTGFAALMDLLLQAPAALHVAGFTFYHDGGNRFREDCPSNLHPEKSHDGKNRRNHNSFAELLILRQLMEIHQGVLTIDAALQDILANSRSE